MTNTQTTDIDPTEEALPGAVTLKEKVAAQTPPAEEWRGPTTTLLSFTGLYALYEKAPAEAWAVRNRLAALINANLTAEEWELLRRYHCAPAIEPPLSHQRPEPPSIWTRYACSLAERRAQELHPGRAVLESWVFGLHNELGVSVVLGPVVEVSP